jgi:hypothetical protein
MSRQDKNLNNNNNNNKFIIKLDFFCETLFLNQSSRKYTTCLSRKRSILKPDQHQVIKITFIEIRTSKFIKC